MAIYLDLKAQIVLLIVKKLIILAKYLDFTNVFLKESTIKFFKWSNINKYIVNLKPDKLSSYKPIHNLRPIQLKILKTYIKTNLAFSLPPQIFC